MARNLLESITLLATRLAAARREVRRRDRGEPRAVRALRRADAVGGDRAQPVHRLRQGARDRQGGRGVGPLAARGRARGRRRRRDPRRGARLPRDGQAARIAQPSQGRASLGGQASCGNLAVARLRAHRRPEPRRRSSSGPRSRCPSKHDDEAPFNRRTDSSRPLLAVDRERHPNELSLLERCHLDLHRGETRDGTVGFAAVPAPEAEVAAIRSAASPIVSVRMRMLPPRQTRFSLPSFRFDSHADPRPCPRRRRRRS